MENLKSIVGKSQKEIIDNIRRIIAAQSFSLNEKDGIKVVAAIMKKAGFDEVKISKVGCVIGRIGKGDKKILFDAHVDTVGIGNIKDWAFDPFKGKVDSEYIYGRGAAENKGSLGAMLAAASIIKKNNLGNNVSVYVIASTQEEDAEGVLIAESLKEFKLKPDFVCLGKFSELKLNRGHRGRMVIEAEFTGRMSHASTPELGDNALYKAAKFITAVEKLNSTLKKDKVLGKGTVSATVIATGGNSVNRIPSKTTVKLDRRLTNGETIEFALKQLKNIAAKGTKIVCEKYDFSTYNGKKVSTIKYFPAFLTPDNHISVKLGEKAYENVFGKKVKAGVWSVSSNGSGTFGFLNIPTIGLGAGEAQFVHQVNEKVRISDILKAVEFYCALVQEFSQL
jgi:putative selenium metabolism hydrolase